MNSQKDPIAYIEKLETLYAAVVADVLDAQGFPDQSLPANIRPLTPTHKIAGRVFTARAITVSEVPEEPYKLEIESVEKMTKGDVFMVDVGYDDTCGFWGELLTTACLYKGVKGVIMTACTRDIWKIKETDFPVFGTGFHPADSKGRADIIEYARPVRIGSVTIHAGDFVIGDEDGVVVIPAKVADETLRLALEKVSGENIAREDLSKGVPMGEVFRKYGIL